MTIVGVAALLYGAPMSVNWGELPDSLDAGIRLIPGFYLIELGAGIWKSVKKPNPSPSLPSWLPHNHFLKPKWSFWLGVALMVSNLRNVALTCMGAILIEHASLNNVAGRRSKKALDHVRRSVLIHGAAASALLLLVIGAFLVIQGGIEHSG